MKPGEYVGTFYSPIEVGQIRVVTGGHGLMLVHAIDNLAQSAEMMAHGGRKQWFYLGRLGRWATKEVVEREREESRARGVECPDPTCWCRSATVTFPPEKP